MGCRFDGGDGIFEITEVHDDSVRATCRELGSSTEFFGSYVIDNLQFPNGKPSIQAKPTQGGKVPFHLLDLGFCAAMCRNWEAGIKEGRTANDWETLPRTNETRERYAAKIMRHLHGYVEQRGVAAEHLAAIACNANILWHIEGRGE
jgi:hypothetical protein